MSDIAEKAQYNGNIIVALDKYFFKRMLDLMKEK